jgi:hypothetical protein
MNGGRCIRGQNEADHYQPATVAGRYHTSGTCQCQKGFSGPYCENGSVNSSCKKDAECFNGGQCLLPSGQRNQDRRDFLQHSSEVARCFCADGFIGNKCQVRDYDIPLKFPTESTTADQTMEAGSIVGVSLGVVIGMAIVFWVLVKYVGGTPSGPTTAHDEDDLGPDQRISMSRTGLRKRRGTTTSSAAIEVGPVFARNASEML